MVGLGTGMACPWYMPTCIYEQTEEGIKAVGGCRDLCLGPNAGNPW